MKTILITCLLGICSWQIFSQTVNKNKFTAELNPFINLNHSDIDTKNSTPGIYQHTNMGSGLGIAYNSNSTRILYFHAGTRLRFSPQSLSFENGTKQSFTNIDWYLTCMMGMRFKVSASNNIIFALGLNNSISLRNKNLDNQFANVPYTDPKTGENLNHLAGVYQVNWGHSSTEGTEWPFITNGVLQFGIENTSLLPHNRKVGVLFEFSTRMDSKPKYGNGNSATYYQFDTDRNLISTQSFADKYTTIGLSFFIGIN